MRIYFVGSHSTGKTTLARTVHNRMKIPMLAETARQVMSEMEIPIDRLRVDIELATVYQDAVFARQLRNEMEAKDDFVSDRAFDNLAYAAEHTKLLPTLVNTQSFRDYVEWLKGGTIFFVRPHRSLMSEDGVRESANWEAIIRIDGMVKILLELYGLDYMPIHPLLMQERMQVIEFVLSRCAPSEKQPGNGKRVEVPRVEDRTVQVS